jgi:hypothetical protein
MARGQWSLWAFRLEAASTSSCGSTHRQGISIIHPQAWPRHRYDPVMSLHRQ